MGQAATVAGGNRQINQGFVAQDEVGRPIGGSRLSFAPVPDFAQHCQSSQWPQFRLLPLRSRQTRSPRIRHTHAGRNRRQAGRKIPAANLGGPWLPILT